jgi:hypothetical protein
MIFVFNKNCKEIFKKLKIKLIFISIFNYYNLKRKIMFKLNALNDIIIEIFL